MLNTFASVMSIIESLAVIIALIYAWGQVKEARRASNLGAIWEIFDMLSSEEMNNARKVVYKSRNQYSLLQQGKGLDDIPHESRHNANKVANTFDRVGYLVKKGLIPEDLLLDNHKYIIARSWIALEPYVYHTREIRGQDSFLEYFQYISDRVFQSYLRKDKVKFSERVNPSVDATAQLSEQTTG